jgi:hypothetical protein
VHRRPSLKTAGQASLERLVSAYVAVSLSSRILNSC